MQTVNVNLPTAAYPIVIEAGLLREAGAYLRTLTNCSRAFVVTDSNVGPIYLTAQTTDDKARAATRAIYAEIAHFNDPNYYTDEELESAKALLEADDLYSREKLSEYSHVLSFWWASTGFEYYRGYL